MKKVLIKTNEIINCWETKDACIVETSSGKKWVCRKEFNADDCQEWNTLVYIIKHQNDDFVALALLEKGKSDYNG